MRQFGTSGTERLNNPRYGVYNLKMFLVGIHVLTHQHRSIILRRFFFHFGTVYLYRVVTISVTILPVPKLPPGHCMSPTDGSLQQIFARSFGQLVGGGMDMTGNNMCG